MSQKTPSKKSGKARLPKPGMKKPGFARTRTARALQEPGLARYRSRGVALPKKKAKEGVPAEGKKEAPSPQMGRIIDLSRRRTTSRIVAALGAAAVIGIMALGASKGEAKTRSSVGVDPTAEITIASAKPFFILPPLEYKEFNDGESASSLLKDRREQTRKYLRNMLRGIEILSETEYRVSATGGKRIEVSLDAKHSQLIFKKITPVSKGNGSARFAATSSFAMQYALLGLEKPVLYVESLGKSLIVRLIDKGTGKCVEIRMDKADFDPENARVMNFDEQAAVEETPEQQAFVILNIVPQASLGGDSRKSRIFRAAFAEGEKTFAAQIAEFDAGEHKGDMNALVEVFIKIYDKMVGSMMDSVRESVKNLPRHEKKQILAEAEPRILAYMLRPYVVWEAMLGAGPGIILELDTIIASHDFSGKKLKAFAGENNLSTEHNGILKKIRRELLAR